MRETLVGRCVWDGLGEAQRRSAPRRSCGAHGSENRQVAGRWAPKSPRGPGNLAEPRRGCRPLGSASGRGEARREAARPCGEVTPSGRGVTSRAGCGVLGTRVPQPLGPQTQGPGARRFPGPPTRTLVRHNLREPRAWKGLGRRGDAVHSARGTARWLAATPADRLQEA